MKRATVLLSLALPIALGGCVSIGPKAPRSLLTLTAASAVAAGVGRTVTADDAISIQTPLAPASIQTTRIPVYDGSSELAYVKDAAWNEPPVRLFQRLLSDTVAQVTGRLVVDQRVTSAAPGLKLSGQLLRFGVDPQAMQAVVTFEGTITRGERIEQRRFETRVPIVAIEAREVGRALNQAANDAAAQVAGWLR